MADRWNIREINKQLTRGKTAVSWRRGRKWKVRNLRKYNHKERGQLTFRGLTIDFHLKKTQIALK